MKEARRTEIHADRSGQTESQIETEIKAEVEGDVPTGTGIGR